VSVAGGTSTGSKRPAALFGAAPGAPDLRMVRSQGARVWDEHDRQYLDFVMALGAVSLGYGHPAVTRAAREAVERGGVGPLPPVDEAALADELAEVMPWLERVRFLKTGAEAVSAAVRIARAATGRDRVIGCGYHGWLDLASTDVGVPGAVRKLYRAIPFDQPAQARAAIEEWGDELACLVVEPVVDGFPSIEWLELLRDEASRVGAVLVFDEIKTGFRVALGGAVERWGVRPDLVVLGKALANGFPLALVGGRRDLMAQVERTWISSTLATEFVALAAARAALRVARTERVPEHLGRVGGQLHRGLEALADKHSRLVAGVRGIPEMCYLQFHDDDTGARVARATAGEGLLFKRSAYNFVSLAHGETDVRRALDVLDGVLAAC
jgi:glutamate-1-semialdehyde 2,1-aminomutase